MFYPNVLSLFITLHLLPQVFVHGSICREVRRKFVGFFKWTKQRPGPFYDSCNLCSFGPCTPMVWPSNDNNFDGSVDAEKIMIAFSAPGEPDDNQKATVANILTERSAPRRTAIAEAFTKKNNKPIIDQLDTKMDRSWRYFMFIKAFSLPLPHFFREQFRLAIYFLGQKKIYQEQGQAIILELLTTLPKCLLDKAIEIFNSMNFRPLGRDIDRALEIIRKPPEYRELIKKLVEQKRDTNQHASWFKAIRDAYKLKSAVISQKDNEMKERFSELFTKFSIPQIVETIVVYENLRHGDKEFKSLLDDIDKYTGSEKEIYKVMARIFSNKPFYYAKTIEDILKSGELEEVYQERLIYLIAGRYDIDLKDIILAYNQQSRTGLRADFEAWDISSKAKSFHPIMLNIIDKASGFSQRKP